MLRLPGTCALPPAIPELREGARGRPPCQPRARLLDLDGRPGLLELGLDRVGLLARHALLDRLRRAVDHVLGLLEAEARDRADHLDHADLLLAGLGQHDVEGALLLRRCPVAAAACRSGDRDRRCRRHAPLLFDLVLQLDELEDGHLPELVEDGVDTAGHYDSSSFAASEAVASSAGWSVLAASEAVASSAGWSMVSVVGSLSVGSGAEAAAPSPPSCSIRASISPTRFWSGALKSPTIAYSGAVTAPSTWPRSWSSGGSLARVSISSAVTARPSSMPPRTASTFVSRAVAPIALATATGSPSASRNAIAVGPSSSASSASAPAASAARRVSVFFTTVNFAPCFKSSVRRSSIWGIVSPR